MSMPLHQSDAAVFLDRDGVLIEDVDLLTCPEQIRILPGVPEALCKLRDARFRLVVVTNQAVVARGLLTESALDDLNRTIEKRLQDSGAPKLDRFYCCPHHPYATVPHYRVVCECRKPQPGLLRQAARDLNLDLSRSFMVGDRLSDIAAGQRAGCRTIWVQTGKHMAPPIETVEAFEKNVKANFTCSTIALAVRWILERQ